MSEVGFTEAANTGFGPELFASTKDVPGNDTDLSSIILERIDAAAWERFAANHADIMQEQTHCFNAARWGVDRLEHNLIRQDGEIVGGALVILIDIPILRRGIAIVKWGPLWRPHTSEWQPANLQKCLVALQQEYAENRGYFLSVMPAPNPGYTELTSGILANLGFTIGRSLPNPDRYLVNVAIPIEELRSSLDQKWRYNLKKSVKSDLRTEIVDTEKGLPQFMDLYGKMLERKGFQDTSAIGTVQSIMQITEKALCPKIFMVYQDGSPTAGAIIDVAGDTAVYLYGATDDRALRLKAGFAMHWRIAEWLSEKPQILWYDLGGSDGEGGLHQFKKGFVGKLGKIVLTPPSYNYSQSFLAEILGRSIFALRDAKGAAMRTVHRIRATMSA